MGLITGAAAVISGFFQIFFSVGARYYPRRILLGLENILYSTAAIGISLAKNFMTFLGSNIIGGVGTASQHPLGVSMLADGFKKTFSRAISIFYGLGYLGNIVAPILLTSISIFWGWRNALLVLATIPATTGIVLILYLRGESVGDKSIITDRSSSLTKDLKSSLKNKTALAIIAAQSLAVGGVG